MTLESRFAAHLGTLGLAPGRAVVAVSGGADSLALLHLLARAAPEARLDLVVAHADHGLHAESGRVAAMVAERAESLGIPIVVGALRLPAGSGESVARRERYRWLRRVVAEQGAAYLMVAHQREDQAETVLMRTLAGSGPAGLAGMAARRGPVVRPLLPFARAELRAYLASAPGWEPWEDPANADTRHTRSWLRTAVLPLLRERDRAVDQRLVRLAEQAAVQREAWDAVLDLLPGLDPKDERGGISVAGTPLQGYDSRLSQTLIQALARRVGVVVGPSAARRVLAMAEGGRSGAWTPLADGWRAELAFGRLRMVRPAGAPSEAVGIGGAEPGELSWGVWRLRWRLEMMAEAPVRDGWTSWFIPGWYTVRPWQPGDRVRPLGGRGARLVVRCMQDARVPRPERVSWPMVEGAQHGPVLWVPGICRGEGAVPSPGTEALKVECES